MRFGCHRTGGDDAYDVYVVMAEGDEEGFEQREDGRNKDVGENGETKAWC